MTSADVTKLIKMIALFRTHADYELEASVGIRPASSSDSEIPRSVPKPDFQHFQKAVAENVENGVFEKVMDGNIAGDCFYADSVRVRCPKIGCSECVRKVPVMKMQGTCALVPTHRFLFHLKQEQDLKTEAERYLTQVPVFLRVTKTWAYKFKNAYLYTFKEVYSGLTKEEALNSTETYEIEIELLHDATYLDAKTDEEIAHSFIQKVLRFCPYINKKDNTACKLSLVFGDVQGGGQLPTPLHVPKPIKIPEMKQTTLQLVPKRTSAIKIKVEEEDNELSQPAAPKRGKKETVKKEPKLTNKK